MSLLKDLKKFKKKENISMHIPGHKSGRGLGAYFIKKAIELDLTELDGTDNLQNPNGALKSAQDFCAKIFGAKQTYFLTGGSSLGLRAAILGCTKRGSKLLVDRTCHKSVISAITLGGVDPIFISPVFDKDKGLYLGITSDIVKEALAKHPDAVGAVVTSPTYYGVCSDIRAVSETLHKQNKFLIADEAHGAHFIFSKHLPHTALSLGADICIQSAHKTLPALGQCSFMHVNSDIIDKTRLERTLRMIQTTSPSYLLMTSLDESVRTMNTSGRHKMNVLLNEIGRLKSAVYKSTSLKFADSDSLGRECDLSRITVDFAPIGISGRYAEKLLIEKFGIYPEMSDGRYVVFIPSVANSKKEIRQLTSALINLGGRCFKNIGYTTAQPLPEVDLAYSPHAAHDMESERVSFDKSPGRICTEVVSACPPGAAVLIPGQRISAEAADYIKQNDVAASIEVLKTR